MAAACGKLEVGLNPSLALDHLQMSRNPRLGSVLCAFLAVRKHAQPMAAVAGISSWSGTQPHLRLQMCGTSSQV